MICNICGTKNENGLKFCMKCGNNLSARVNNEPFIPRLDTERVSLPQPGSTPMQSPQNPSQQNINNMQGPPPVNIPQQPINNPYMNMPPPMYNQPQIIGYDPSGMPIYAQIPPMYNQYGQPQIIGYDPSGMPIYAQPPPMYNQYSQPQIIGYDPSGMPIYAQQPPPVYNQYSQPQTMGYPPPAPPPAPTPQEVPDMPILNMPEPPEEKIDVPDDFWAFFDGGKSSQDREEQSPDDFFGKSVHSDAMGDVSIAGLDISSLRHAETKKNSYMSDTPLVDASKLEKNDVSKLNQMYMKKADDVNSNDLGDTSRKRISERDKMGATKQVDASRIAVKIKVKPKVSMNSAGQADPDSLETYIPKHNEAIMAKADHAVEAMPKRFNPYENEIDSIELPEYMQAKKTKREDSVEIPSIPELK